MIISGGIVFGAVASPPANPLILADNVEQHTRLKQPPTWNISVASSQEIADAYIAVASKYGVTAKDISNAGGNIQLAIQKKMATMFLLCDNANTNKL